MSKRLAPGDTVRLMDRSFGICVDYSLDAEPVDRSGGLKVFPAYPCQTLPCLDKVGKEHLYGDENMNLVEADDCFYTVLNVDVQALGLTARGVREDQPLNIALVSNQTGAVIFTNTRFVEAPSLVERVQVVNEEVWNDDLIGLSADQRRQYVAGRGW